MYESLHHSDLFLGGLGLADGIREVSGGRFIIHAVSRPHQLLCSGRLFDKTFAPQRSGEKQGSFASANALGEPGGILTRDIYLFCGDHAKVTMRSEAIFVPWHQLLKVGRQGSNVERDGESTDVVAVGVVVPDFRDAAHETGDLERAQGRGEWPGLATGASCNGTL